MIVVIERYMVPVASFELSEQLLYFYCVGVDGVYSTPTTDRCICCPTPSVDPASQSETRHQLILSTSFD